MNNKLDKQQMFIDNHKLIYVTMKKYFPHIYANFQEREDYYQIGAIALLKAIERYNSDIASFSTYAISLIWGEMKRYTREQSRICHYSRTIVDIANNLIMTYNKHEIDEEFESWMHTQIQLLDITYDDRLAIISYLNESISLDSFIRFDDDDSLTVENCIASPINVENDIEYKSYIDNIYNQLNDREKKIFMGHLNGYKQQIIGDNNGLSQAQISRVLKKIKCLSIKELYDAENYTLVNKLLYETFKTDRDIYQICKRYHMNFQKISNYNKCKKTIDLLSNLTKNYSLNDINKLIIKCTMKLILKNQTSINNENFKQLIHKLLSSKGYNNSSIMNYLNNMTNSHIENYIDVAKTNIDKYNYKFEYEIVIDTSDYESSKFVKYDTYYNDIGRFKKNKTNKSNNLLENIVTILKCFKKDNSMIRF